MRYALQKIEDLLEEENPFFFNSKEPKIIDFYGYQFLARIWMAKGSIKDYWNSKIGLNSFPKISRLVQNIENKEELKGSLTQASAY